jgi:hypothetical protein
MALFPRDMKGNNFYIWIGTFALLLMLWLWVGPKIVKKPAGTPPRAGSNEEAKELARATAGVPPQPVRGGGGLPVGGPTSSIRVPALNAPGAGAMSMGPVRFAKAALSDMYPVSHISIA